MRGVEGYAAMRLAANGQKNPGSGPVQSTARVRCNEAGRERPEERRPPRGVLPLGDAAMRLAANGQKNSSLILEQLSCGNRRLCERSAGAPDNVAPYGRVKMLTQALTCGRALPGGGGTTSALAMLVVAFRR